MDVKAVVEVEERNAKMGRLLEDPEVQQLLIQKLQELKLA